MHPEPGVWSPIEYLAHTVDTIDWYHERIVAVLSQPGVKLRPLDWDSACKQRRYGERDVNLTIDDLQRACEALTALLQELEPASWQQAGVGSSDGESRTVLTLGRRAAHELHHHHHDIDRSTR